MRRRDFIRTIAPITFMGGFKISALSRLPFFGMLDGAADNDHVLVLVQLVGGNDGLNTLIPLSNYSDYYSARSNIAIPESKVLKLSQDNKNGLHPAMTGLDRKSVV